ncbi:hypothetical protein KS4_29120 [Poriferisphaera corsica]|uniref:Response regulatory domain-containing protein n=1 Tax=Poriferisphaera corsica TaxID=2528020 RepID=A0A517YX84_9BACT|nr:hypothetical protein [Poriferisphaera corsica]QDU34836.1 hypothetical protein KS4_29120 [Poriferisphaera corsica]
MPITQIILVGHCGFDTANLTRFIKKHTDLPIHAAQSPKELTPYLSPDALLLINRVIPRAFKLPTGIELIAQLNQQPNPPRSLLISNFPESQQQAITAGALPGFGKSHLTDQKSIKLLTDALQ